MDYQFAYFHKACNGLFRQHQERFNCGYTLALEDQARQRPIVPDLSDISDGEKS